MPASTQNDGRFIPKFSYICHMKQTPKNTMTVNNDDLRDSIIRSLIASFKIEKINISETTAYEIYKRVKIKLKK